MGFVIKICPDGGSVNNWFWHMDNLENEEYFSKYLYEIICDKLNINYKIGRIYANGKTMVIHILMMEILLFILSKSTMGIRLARTSNFFRRWK